MRTDLAGEDSSRNKVARELSPAALRAADRVAGRVGRELPASERRPYLCHTLCELGSEPLDDELGVISAFLDANPREAVILFVEPYVPVDDLERAFASAGLLEQAAELRRDEPLPTLGELARAGTRLIVLAEEDGGARPWYLPRFSFVQDTPLGAEAPAELRCRRSRGSADSPLYLINHWIPPYPPSVSRNALIGGRVLERRLDRCERSRRLVPNLVAVDFYERSGVVDIAREQRALARTRAGDGLARQPDQRLPGRRVVLVNERGGGVEERHRVQRRPPGRVAHARRDRPEGRQVAAGARDRERHQRAADVDRRELLGAALGQRVGVGPEHLGDRRRERRSRARALVLAVASAYSHSMVPGGFDVMSSTTRLTSRISLIMREAICSSRS